MLSSAVHGIAKARRAVLDGEELAGVRAHLGRTAAAGDSEHEAKQQRYSLSLDSASSSTRRTPRVNVGERRVSPAASTENLYSG